MQLTLLSLCRRAGRFGLVSFITSMGGPSREVLNERVNQIQKGQLLTLDGAVVTASVMMVQALVAQVRQSLLPQCRNRIGACRASRR